MIRRLRKLHRRQEGTAMTEFAIFLPVWVMVFIGLTALGRIGGHTTATKLRAIDQVWSRAVPVSYEVKPEHMSLQGAMIHAEATLIPWTTNMDNDQQLADGVEAGVMGMMAAQGHWGESYSRTILYSFLFDEMPDPKLDASDVMGDQPYPLSLMDDGIPSTTPDGIIGVIRALLSGTGATAALAAGIRYGMVFGESAQTIQLPARQTMYTAAHYDTAVPPMPQRTNLEQSVTFAFAWVYAQGEDNYYVMMNFGESEWESSGGGSSGASTLPGLGDPDDELDQAGSDLDDGREEAAEKKKELEEQQEE